MPNVFGLAPDSKVLFPARCACCLESTDESIHASFSGQVGTTMINGSVDVPMCPGCRVHTRQWRALLALFILLGVGLGALLFVLPALGGSLALGIVGLPLAIAAVVTGYRKLRGDWTRRHPSHAHPGNPFVVAVDSGRTTSYYRVTIRFRNEQYAALFAEANPTAQFA